MITNVEEEKWQDFVQNMAGMKKKIVHLVREIGCEKNGWQ